MGRGEGGRLRRGIISYSNIFIPSFAFDGVRAKVYGSDGDEFIRTWAMSLRVIATPDCASTLGMILIVPDCSVYTARVCTYVHAFIRPSRIRGRRATSVPDTYTHKHHNPYTLDKSMRHGDSLQSTDASVCVLCICIRGEKKKNTVNIRRAMRREEERSMRCGSSLDPWNNADRPSDLYEYWWIFLEPRPDRSFLSAGTIVFPSVCLSTFSSIFFDKRQDISWLFLRCFFF